MTRYQRLVDITRPQKLGLLLAAATYIGWPFMPGWEPFNLVDFASIPLCVGSVMLIFGRQRP